MYEIRCLVKDKHLALLLRALDPIAVEPPVVKPVDGGDESSVNVGMYQERQPKVKKPAARRQRKLGEGTLTDRIKELLRDDPERKTFFAKEARRLADSLGYQYGSYSFAVGKLQKDGILVKTKNVKVTGEYTINREKLNEEDNSGL